MPSMVDTRTPAPGGLALFDAPGSSPTCLDRCRNAAAAQEAVLTALADVDAHATILATSVGGSGTLRMLLASPSTAARLAEILGLAPAPLPHGGWPTQWMGLVGEVGFVLTALPPGGES
ncbi:MAG TPA: hypothetical protein VFP72_14550 [Kineosporiaceae bacterium]|nr:hypothetical protein [Kineosporiaceae bacterium]